MMSTSASLHEARLRLDRLDYSHYFGSIVKRFGSLEGRRIKEYMGRVLRPMCVAVAALNGLLVVPSGQYIHVK